MSTNEAFGDAQHDGYTIITRRPDGSIKSVWWPPTVEGVAIKYTHQGADPAILREPVPAVPDLSGRWCLLAFDPDYLVWSTYDEDGCELRRFARKGSGPWISVAAAGMHAQHVDSYNAQRWGLKKEAAQ